MNQDWVLLLSVPFALSLVLTPLVREVCRAAGFVDYPDGARKTHRAPVPRGGGLAIVVSFVTAFLILQFRAGGLDSQLALVWRVLPAAAIVFAVGIVDDRWNLVPWQKLTGQLLAAGVACSSQILINHVAGLAVPAWWSIPVTVLWLLACTNGFNLVDGMDGLAAGAGLVAAVTIFVAALLQRNLALEAAALVLIGCLLGFLGYNFNPATIFLGDSGSLTIGFVLGCYTIIWSQKSATLLSIVAPVMVLAVPLLDVTLAITRRLLNRQPIFGADRGHIHHRLLDRGMSPRKVAFLLYAVCGVAAVFSLLESIVVDNRISTLIVLLFGAFIWLCVQSLDYAEFEATRKLLFGGELQRTVKAQIDLQAFEKQIGDTAHPKLCVEIICETAAKFGFSVTDIQFAGECHIEPVSRLDACWEVRIPLREGDFITLARDSRPALSHSEYFLDALRVGLLARFPFSAAAKSGAGVAAAATSSAVPNMTEYTKAGPIRPAQRAAHR